VKQAEDLSVYHVRKATESVAASFGSGNTTMPLNVMLVANVIQLWIILNF
jgi:hypothetical protein